METISAIAFSACATWGLICVARHAAIIVRSLLPLLLVTIISSTSQAAVTWTLGTNEVSDGNALTRTTGEGWDNSNYTAEQFTAVSVEFTMTAGSVVALDADGTVDDGVFFDYSIHWSTFGNLVIFESPGTVVQLGQGSEGVTYRLEFDGSEIKYYAGGTLIHTTTAANGTTSLRLAAALGTAQSTVLFSSGSGSLVGGASWSLVSGSGGGGSGGGGNGNPSVDSTTLAQLVFLGQVQAFALSAMVGVELMRVLLAGKSQTRIW